MTVAVKNAPEISTRSVFDRLAVASLAGVVYVLGSIAIVVQGLPALWWNYLGLSRDWYPAWALLIVAMLAAAGGLVYVGGRLLGASPPHGIRAGIFVGLIGVLAIAWIALWLGGMIESWSFDKGWFSQPVAIGITITLGLVLLVLFGRFFFKPGFENFLRRFEDQGWFHAIAYKSNQGLKVRRGTMLGLLIIIGSGVWAYERSLQSGPDSWGVSVPFTGTFTARDLGDAARAPRLDVEWQTVRILDAGDWPDFKAGQLTTQTQVNKVKEELAGGVKIRKTDADRFQDSDFINRDALVVKQDAFKKVQAGAAEKIAAEPPRPPKEAPVLDRYYEREKNDRLEHDYVKIVRAGETAVFKADEVVPVDTFKEVEKKQQEQISALEQDAQQLKDKDPPDLLGARRKEEEANRLKGLLPTATAPAKMTGAVEFQRFTVVPAVRFVMPLLLAALALWFAWRLVNLPSFADFLIATEAELNKVSWTPRRRLVQDTIVVLVTTLLITVFLLFADLIWSQLLTRVGVLQAPTKDTSEVQTTGEDLPW